MSTLLKYALRLTREYKENIIPHFDNLTRMRNLIDGTVKSDDVSRFNCNDRDELISACVQINVQTYMPNAVIDMRKQPKCVYFRICQNCRLAADVPAPNDHSVLRYLCIGCGTCLVIDDPLDVFGETEEGVNELLQVQRINAGGEL
ncbi:hypothetical protein [Thysanoplusia orichalcea nucleopolyhedrovirus]|uniref:Uncharacterized protein n=1 Tax=Thysanoplusia orichalcea nucleopolyhedrovirus TaxID=101850 RepID=L0CL34_9ABAC|nr:hypothetical protein [Thysanoplusia orichalcea nucleopolyhedrovirus]AGA16160.1 hypothetical protein [Thysanoplusia orichalcea nucleopolyhedrovirus]